MDGWTDRQTDGRTDGKVAHRGGRPSCSCHSLSRHVEYIFRILNHLVMKLDQLINIVMDKNFKKYYK